MNRTPVSSSNIRSVGYDEATATLEIEFESGDIYQYDGVPLDLYKGLLKASSVGTFFHTYVKRAFSARKVR